MSEYRKLGIVIIVYIFAFFAAVDSVIFQDSINCADDPDIEVFVC